MLALTESQKQRLFNDGISRREYQRNTGQWYSRCPECISTFDPLEPCEQDKVIPNLLECGHVCCTLCLTNSPKCPCCTKVKVLKKSNYLLILGIEPHPPQQTVKTPEVKTKTETPTQSHNALYDFHIANITLSSLLSVRNVRSNTTIQQVLAQFDEFVEYQQGQPKVKLVLCNKTYSYNQIRNKPISEFKDILKQNKGNNSNSILILNRVLKAFKQQNS